MGRNGDNSSRLRAMQAARWWLVGGLCSTNPLKATIKTAQQRTIIQQYDCWHTGR